MFDLIKRENGIFEWHNVMPEPQILIENAISNNWFSYTNEGGGSTVLGRSTILETDNQGYDAILDVFNKCLSEYIDENKLDITNEHMGIGWWLVREYLPGSEMTAHSDIYSYVTDNGNPVTPYLTAILYLNDDYVGGEISFPEQNLVIKPKPGSVVIFKSNTLHEVLPITEGSRYMTQTYIYEKQFSEYQDMNGKKAN